MPIDELYFQIAMAVALMNLACRTRHFRGEKNAFGVVKDFRRCWELNGMKALDTLCPEPEKEVDDVAKASVDLPVYKVALKLLSPECGSEFVKEVCESLSQVLSKVVVYSRFYFHYSFLQDFNSLSLSSPQYQQVLTTESSERTTQIIESMLDCVLECLEVKVTLGNVGNGGDGFESKIKTSASGTSTPMSTSTGKGTQTQENDNISPRRLMLKSLEQALSNLMDQLPPFLINPRPRSDCDRDPLLPNHPSRQVNSNSNSSEIHSEVNTKMDMEEDKRVSLNLSQGSVISADAYAVLPLVLLERLLERGLVDLAANGVEVQLLLTLVEGYAPMLRALSAKDASKNMGTFVRFVCSYYTGYSI